MYIRKIFWHAKSNTSIIILIQSIGNFNLQKVKETFYLVQFLGLVLLINTMSF